MKEIKLTQGFVALVDDEDYEYLNQFKWCVSGIKNPYALRGVYVNKKHCFIMMHRAIMKTPNNLYVDHIDHNGLNNKKANLRNCSRSQNSMNSIPNKNKSSKYKGVSYNNKYIRAIIKINNKNIYLGYFKTEEEAAIRYDEYAKKYFGEFANLNFK